MSIKYLVKDSMIPNDGSKKIIEDFYNSTSDHELDLLIYPDVHYKKGSRVVNGMLTASNNRIYPAMLGVANCGFTFGLMENVSINDRLSIEKSFETYSKKLKAYNTEKVYKNEEIISLFHDYSKTFYLDKMYKDFFDYININSEADLMNMVNEILTYNHIDLASKSLGTLGGGNHFFELQHVEESFSSEFKTENIIFILHSDSIAIGDRINLLFSNLSELDFIKGFKGFALKSINRIRQLNYFIFKNGLLWKEPKQLLNLLFSQNDYRFVLSNSYTGKTLLKAFFIATIFGEMNRDMILKNYLKHSRKIFPDLKLKIFGSHSHDSLMVQKKNKNFKIVQRNGVQFIHDNKFFILPGALGTESYLMKNPNNTDAYLSANHGVGRVLDKHIAKSKFNARETELELHQRNMKLYRVGKGNIGEQHPAAFKNVLGVAKEMKANNLGTRICKLRPICSMKG